jgi:Zinc knuckle
MPEASTRSQSEATTSRPIPSDHNPDTAGQPTLAELAARVTTLEKIAQIEERLTRLENRKRTSDAIDDLIDQPQPSQPDHVFSGSSSGHPTSPKWPSIEEDTDSSENTHFRPLKRTRYSRGIKVTPSYTLRISSSLREWGDWKRDIERVFEGDPDTYQTGAQRILKALDYLDPSLKSLWYTYNDQKKGIHKWATFINWTRDNIQNGQNATATLYEQLNAAKQLPDRPPVQFNAYLSAIERDLPQQDEKASAMTFYSKLSPELKRQFRTSAITIPETRAQCVSVAQHVWEGLYSPEKRRGTQPYSYSPRDQHQDQPRDRDRNQPSSSKYSRPDYRPDHTKQRQYTTYRKEERHTSTKPREKQLICYNCQQPGHYSSDCPKRKDQAERQPKAKIQAAQQAYTRASTPGSPSPRPEDPYTPSGEPQTPGSPDSYDSLN